MTKITIERLINEGYVKKEKMGTSYYQKGIVILIYRDLGIWEFCAEHATEMSDNIPVTTFEEIELLTREK